MSADRNKIGMLSILSKLHMALMTGLIIFCGITFLMVFNKWSSTVSVQIDRILQVISVLFCFAGFYFGRFGYNKKVELIKNMTGSTLEQRLEVYRSACIVQWALLEAPALFTVICFFLTGNYAFLMLAVVMLVIFAVLGPSKIKITYHLQLDNNEADRL